MSAGPGIRMATPRLPPQAVPDQPPTLGATAPNSFQFANWALLVQRICENDATAEEELYGIFAQGIGYFLLRSLGPAGLDDRVRNCIASVAEAIRKGDLRSPDRLPGYVLSVVKGQTAGSTRHAEIAPRVLIDMAPRHVEILKRFYVLEQSEEQICGEMRLSSDQFRRLKSRAKERFGEFKNNEGRVAPEVLD